MVDGRDPLGVTQDYTFPMLRWLLLLTFIVAGCGDSSPYQPAGPSSVVHPARASIGGRYAGTIFFRDTRGPNQLTITVRLHQSGQAIEGTWATLHDGSITGTISGTLASLDPATALTTRWTMDAPGGSGRCTGSVQADGTAIPLVLSAPLWALSGCVPLEDVRWVLNIAWGEI